MLRSSTKTGPSSGGASPSKCPARHYYQSKAPFFARDVPVTFRPYFSAVPLEEIKGDFHTSSRIAVSDSAWYAKTIGLVDVMSR